jgi:hypothetical protein
MKNIYKITLLICVGLLFGCSGGGDDSPNGCGDLNLKVFGGDQCRFERSPVVAIVGFAIDGTPIGVCSATMVTVNDALTAAHCSELTSAPGGAGVFADGVFHSIVTGTNHPLYDGSTASPYDVAMITIDRVLDIAPVPLLISDSIAVDESITIFGYGKNEDYTGIPQATDFRAGFMDIGAITPFEFAAKFNSRGSAVCQGDSGGPATQRVNGVTSIVGVTTYTINGCQDGAVSGFVNVQNPQIYQFIKAYAADVTLR